MKNITASKREDLNVTVQINSDVAIQDSLVEGLLSEEEEEVWARGRDFEAVQHTRGGW